MALIISTFRHNYIRQVSCSLRFIKQPACELPSERNISSTYGETVYVTKTDPLDSFTSKLVKEKSEKWKYLNSKKLKHSERKLLLDDTNQSFIKFCDIDIIAINELFRKAIDSQLFHVILLLLDICKTKKICPNSALLLEVASIFSRQGNKAGVEAVRLLCKFHNQSEYSFQAEFKHYVAEATWVNGNVDEALGIFEEVYKNYPSFRRRVRNMTKYLIAECVYNRSEASVVLVTNFARKHATEYGDFYFLAYLWQYLFLSEWFADQKLANILIEDYSGMRAIIVDRLHLIAAVAIEKNETDIVQRLFEVTLCYNMKKQYTYILRSYFDYKCSIGDLKSCIEIQASALDENVTLTSEQHKKFLALLLSSSNGNSWLSRRKNIEYLHKQIKVPPFQMKF